jgi:hypothetical protein
MIYWSAKNNSSFLNGCRKAASLRAAVRDARRYLDGELYGEGTITYYDDPECFYPIREDEKSIFTGYKWVKRTEF